MNVKFQRKWGGERPRFEGDSGQRQDQGEEAESI